jgi:hypothetical protein
MLYFRIFATNNKFESDAIWYVNIDTLKFVWVLYSEFCNCKIVVVIKQEHSYERQQFRAVCVFCLLIGSC